MNNVDFPATLLISSVGYKSSEIKVLPGQQGTTIKLQLDRALLGEVVVVGYTLPKKTKRKALKEIKKNEKISITAPTVLAYPNPVIAGSVLNVQCRNIERGSYRAELYTLTGQLVQASRLTHNNEDRQMGLQIGQLIVGTYLLRLTNEKSGKYFNQQIVVHK